MKFQKTLVYPVTVQFEDIDAGGVVHNPNYLKYYERARNNHLAESGILMSELFKNNVALALGEVNLKFVRPALMDQKLFVLTRITSASKIAFRVDQAITNKEPSSTIDELGDDLSKVEGVINLSQTKIICVDIKKIRPVRFPENLAIAMEIPSDTAGTEKSNVDLHSF